MARKVRTLRHWKQRYNPNARFLFRKRTPWDANRTFEAGDEVPPGLLPEHRLRRFWEAGRIELAEFDEPRDVRCGFNHAADNPVRAAILSEVSVEQLGGNWYLVKYGAEQWKLRGRRELNERLDALAAAIRKPQDDAAAKAEAERLEREQAEAAAKAEAEAAAEAERVAREQAEADAKADAEAAAALAAAEAAGKARTDSAPATPPGDQGPGTDPGTATLEDDGAPVDRAESDAGSEPTAPPDATNAPSSETEAPEGATNPGSGATNDTAGADTAGDNGEEGGGEAGPGTDPGTASDASSSRTGGRVPPLEPDAARAMPMETLRQLGEPFGLKGRSKEELVAGLQTVGVVAQDQEQAR